MKSLMQELARLLSDLLEYPVEHPRDTLLKIQAVRVLSEPVAGGELDEALDAIRIALITLEEKYATAALSELQVAHVDVFDLSPECSLNLTWHKYGDSPRQGRALAGITELYKDYGFDMIGANLPDYLPILLEFLGTAPDDATRILMDGFGKELRDLATRISETSTVYAGVGRCLTILTDGFASLGQVQYPSPGSLYNHCSKGDDPCMAG